MNNTLTRILRETLIVFADKILGIICTESELLVATGRPSFHLCMHARTPVDDISDHGVPVSSGFEVVRGEEVGHRMRVLYTTELAILEGGGEQN